MVKLSIILCFLATVASWVAAAPAKAVTTKAAAKTTAKAAVKTTARATVLTTAKPTAKTTVKVTANNTVKASVKTTAKVTANNTVKTTAKTTSKNAAATSTPKTGSSGGGGCTFTDAASVAKGKTGCSTITLNGIAVPAGTTLDLTGLNSGTHVIFQGTTTFGYEEWSGPLVSVSGTSITVTGASGSVIDGGGARWWDGKGSNGGKTKPKFFFAHSLKTSTITGLTFKNSPVQLMSINSCAGLTVSGLTFDNSAGSSQGHNTDAFDVGSSSDVTISGANISNQDDCLAINSGTNIAFTGGTCNGGHGLSIGSVGGRTDNVVKGITISSSTIKNSANGVRIKTVSGATGSVSGVTYKDITLSGISSYGIVIEQDYENGSPTGKPTTGVPITGLVMSNIKGSVMSGATNIYILCGSGSCSGWSCSGISVSGGKASAKCSNMPGGGCTC